MATTLPIPIEFELPEGWVAAPPDEVGAPDAAFVALHPAPAGSGFTPNITIGGDYRPDPASLEQIADESVRNLAAYTGEVNLGRRTGFGDAGAPGLSQVVRMRQEVDGTERALAQCQVYLSMSDVDDAARRVVLRLALTATEEQLDDVLGDFQRFVSSVRVE